MLAFSLRTSSCQDLRRTTVFSVSQQTFKMPISRYSGPEWHRPVLQSINRPQYKRQKILGLALARCPTHLFTIYLSTSAALCWEQSLLLTDIQLTSIAPNPDRIACNAKSLGIPPRTQASECTSNCPVASFSLSKTTVKPGRTTGLIRDIQN